MLCLAAGAASFAPGTRAQSVDPADQVCPRSPAGSVLQDPPSLRSQNGVLEVTFQFKTVVDVQGLARYCFVSDAGLEAPTLHVSPGDQLIIHLQNTLAAAPAGQQPVPKLRRAATPASPNNDCMGGAMGPDVTNLHFHGLNVPPTCHQDEVINTLVQPSGTFDYTVQIPSDEPTGLYWYHPHPHGFSNLQALGGATGAIIVDGIENVVPAVAGLPQRVLVFRDQLRVGPREPQGPSLDLSVNYVPVTAPALVPAVVQTPVATTEFWRALNACADTLLQLQYVVDGVPQPVQLVALDGVPIGQGTGNIQTLTQTSIAIPPGARAEFIVVTPKAGQSAQLITQALDTGPEGAADPMRVLATVVAQAGTATTSRLGQVRTTVRLTRFAQVATAPPDGRRTLYFSESAAGADAAFFITVQGQTPVAYQMGDAPSIVLHQGTTEEWTVENRTLGDHVFHIHQTRFQTLAINGSPVEDPALRDTINVPHWSGTGAYPSVKLRVDFRSPNIVGTFVYHCHILAHEDLGMMATIQVLPVGVATTSTVSASASELLPGAPLTLTASVVAASSGSALSGSVQFFDGDAPLGDPMPVAGGQAVLATQLAASGSHSISAAYSGDDSRNQSLSEAVAVAVEDFTLTTQALVIKQGQSGSVPVAMRTSSGFSSRVDFTCSVPANLTGTTCTVSPSSLGAAGSVTLEISTSSKMALNAAARHLPVTLATLSCLMLPWRRRRRALTVLAALGAIMLLGVGCSGSHPANSGTPPGNYTVSVTGKCGNDAAPITHTLAVAVQVL
ncbi:MAG TPA: multicopper oxidase domain-containing protein [Steroidobacteraceae bacterium]|jgi:FtsP/CotA-like multicopper oxidase with cupredoxin domain